MIFSLDDITHWPTIRIVSAEYPSERYAIKYLFFKYGYPFQQGHTYHIVINPQSSFSFSIGIIKINNLEHDCIYRIAPKFDMTEYPYFIKAKSDLDAIKKMFRMGLENSFSTGKRLKVSINKYKDEQFVSRVLTITLR